VGEVLGDPVASGRGGVVGSGHELTQVLGSEITLEQGLAGYIIEQVLAALARGCTIGEALHQTRWHPIGRGNLMGLASGRRQSPEVSV